MADARSTTTTSSAKRKRAAKIAYYAVHQGHKPDVYLSWPEAQKQITGYNDPKHESFPTLAEAEEYVRTGRSRKTKPPKQEYFYAVHTDQFNRVFPDWTSASTAMKGQKGIKHHKFKTCEEAWAHLESLKAGTPMSAKSETSKASKKLKKNDGTAVEPAITSTYFEPATGPLPSGAEDGFDNRAIFNPLNGKVEHKTEAQLNAKKLQPTGDFGGPLIIYTDGSSLGNGKVGAVAGLGVWFGPGDDRNFSGPVHGRQTNQRAELLAISRALDIAPIDKDVLIYSDSNYSIKCVTEWSKNWERHDWKNSAGKAVENQDIIKPILARIKERNLTRAQTKLVWLKGHAKDPGNEAADRLAVSASQAEVQRRSAEAEALKHSHEDGESEPDDAEVPEEDGIFWKLAREAALDAAFDISWPKQ
ncbi:ribonuclease H-like protein [Pleomassaria siparia CBS 279.74]|uniref:ribonuclease H n=1 Tax=Pleomassaria siparia CBS 279.74 TaxID=1314801 RepID=A0A6G1KEF2_9PLEO|nr:ribonuclease H-like protein [Pleomassaria siparia CBS 279.74]